MDLLDDVLEGTRNLLLVLAFIMSLPLLLPMMLISLGWTLIQRLLEKWEERKLDRLFKSPTQKSQSQQPKTDQPDQ